MGEVFEGRRGEIKGEWSVIFFSLFYFIIIFFFFTVVTPLGVYSQPQSPPCSSIKKY